jgi:hypothetical protein
LSKWGSWCDMAKDGEPIIPPIELDEVEGDVHKYMIPEN